MKQKLRSTTPGFKKRAISSFLIVSAIVMASSSTLNVFADRYDEQIAQLKNEAANYQNQAAALRAQGDTLQNALNVITADKNALQKEIDLNEAKLTQLKADIAANELKLDRQKKTLSKTVAQIYVNSTTTPIEVLASSKSVGDYVSSQAVRSSIKGQLKKSMDSIKDLQAQLATQQTDVEHVLADQADRRASIAAKEAEQANLVAQTRGEEAAYQGLVASKNSEIDSLRAQQRAANAALGGKAVAGDPNMGGYPNNLRGGKDTTVDPWGMYNRECVSYTAWKVYQKNGYMPYWGGRGNANQWPGSAQADGIPTGSTPKVGSVAISMSGYYGHAMWVEQVSGSKIYVSQMNYDLAGSYSEMWVDGSNFVYIYF